MLGGLFSRAIPKFGSACQQQRLASGMLPVFRQFMNPILPRIGMTAALPRPTVSPTKQIVRGMANHRHKKYVKLAKGFRGRANGCYKLARLRVEKARQYAYKDRKIRKRDYRKLWIQRINAGTRMYGITYNAFICRLLRSGITLNRKVLSELAIDEPLSFKSVVDVVKQVKA